MNENFIIVGIKNKFNHFFNLSKEELSSIGAVIKIADEKPGYPCRVSLEDVEIGEEVVLIPFQHHTTNSPYQASGPIFIGKNAKSPDIGVNEIPEMLLHRLLSLRVYDKNGMMIDAETIKGEELRNSITNIFKNSEACYIQVHNSSHGCYNCQVNRVKDS